MATLTLPVPIGIGTMLWGNTWLDKKVNGRLLTPAQTAEIVKAATDRGVTFFDTAEGYGGGSCEEMLCEAFHLCGFSTAAMTSDFVLASKFLPTLWRWTESSFITALEESNKRLGVSVSPLFFIHSPIHPLPIEVWVRAAGKCYQQGKLKTLGLSNCDADQIRRCVAAAKPFGLPIVANQILMNLLVYQSPKLQETLAVCKEYNITVIAYSPIGQGLLTDSLTKEKAKGIRFMRMAKLQFEDLTPLRTALKHIGEREGCSMAQVSLRWIMEKGAVPLVGTRSVEQLDDSMGALRVHLTPKDVEALDAASLGRHTFEKPRWRRSLFVVFISLLMSCYRLNRFVQRLQQSIFGSGSNASTSKSKVD